MRGEYIFPNGFTGNLSGAMVIVDYFIALVTILVYNAFLIWIPGEIVLKFGIYNGDD